MAKHVAVVGAGLGGLRAAEQLRAAGHDGPVTVVGAEPHLPYNRPPLSKELLAQDEGGDDLTALHARVAFRRRASVADVTFLLGAAAIAADPAAGKLTLADGLVLRFDGLVAASGLRPRRLTVPGPAGPGSGRHVVRTLDDCLALRAGLRTALRGGAVRQRVVVVGGGFVGCEVARTALALGCDVTVAEPAGPPMLRAKLSGDPVDPNPFGPLPSFWSDQGDLRLQSYGSPGLADDVRIAEGDPREPGRGLLATYHRGGRLVGTVTVNLPPVRHRELREALLMAAA